MELTRPRALLFDWDNTLVDTWPVIHHALHQTMAHWNLPCWSMEEVKLRVGKSMRDAFPTIFGNEWEAAGDYYLQQYRACHLEQLQPLQHALPVIEYAHTANVFSALVSNKTSRNLHIEVKHLGWASYFDAIIGAGDAARDKPAADPAALALQGTDIKMAPDVWFIGDTITDLGCAQAGNMTAILYGDVALDARQTTYRDYPVHAHARDHNDLLKLLQHYV